ncbi:MAG: YigZ family protein, partial [Firmicutes bacterium]|nr:YigZ family protein [Bacillota bacterium]
MAVLYTTVEKEAAAEQTIERSRFIAYIKPVASREEAEAFFEWVNERHKDARHCVPAFV